jgi:ribonuclease HI
MIVTTKQKQSPAPTTVLLLREEMIKLLRVSKTQMAEYLKDGMPHYLIGQEYRFLETEVMEWLETYKPSQERLEREFRDKHGRTIEEYVTGETVVATLRISTAGLKNLCKKGMPYVTVGKNDFFHIQDILDYFRKGDSVTQKANVIEKELLTPKPVVNHPIMNTIESAKKKNKEILQDIGSHLSKKIPYIIVDGSYKYENNTVGTGLVMVENWECVTGFSNVRSIKTLKTNICEYLAVLDALRMIKRKNIKKAIIVTDQVPFSKGIQIDVKKANYEAAVKPYMKEIKELLEDLKGKVNLQFVGILKGGKKNLLHKKAHILSREYKKDVYENMDI